jgi:hypothetical protein
LTLQQYFQIPMFKRMYQIGFGGIALISLGYLLRFQIGSSQGAAGLFLDTFPNLFGSFGTPFLLLLLVTTLQKDMGMLRNFRMFAMLNIFTFLVVLLIEWGHVVLNLGVWDMNDVLASIAGGLAAIIAWLFFVKR